MTRAALRIPGYEHERDSCPNLANHTRGPADYHAAAEWGHAMLKTHHQERCPDCGYFVIWTPK